MSMHWINWNRHARNKITNYKLTGTVASWISCNAPQQKLGYVATEMLQVLAHMKDRESRKSEQMSQPSERADENKMLRNWQRWVPELKLSSAQLKHVTAPSKKVHSNFWKFHAFNPFGELHEYIDDGQSLQPKINVQNITGFSYHQF